MPMHIIKIGLTVIMSLTILLGLLLTSLTIAVFTNNWLLTNVQISDFAPEIFKGSLAISVPTEITKVDTNSFVVLGSRNGEAQLGRVIDYEPRENFYIIRAFSGGSNSSVISASVNEKVNTVVIAIPLLGFLVGIAQNPFLAFLSFGVVIGIVILFWKKFFISKPKPVVIVDPEINQLKIFKEIWDEAPLRKPTRKEKREILKNQRKQVTN